MTLIKTRVAAMIAAYNNTRLNRFSLPYPNSLLIQVEAAPLMRLGWAIPLRFEAIFLTAQGAIELCSDR